MSKLQKLFELAKTVTCLGITVTDISPCMALSPLGLVAYFCAQKLSAGKNQFTGGGQTPLLPHKFGGMATESVGG